VPLHSVRCPQCGASVELDPTATIVRCTHCGSSLIAAPNASGQQRALLAAVAMGAYLLLAGRSQSSDYQALARSSAAAAEEKYAPAIAELDERIRTAQAGVAELQAAMDRLSDKN